MKNIYFVTIMSLIIIGNLAQAQIYKPLGFKNYTPIWSHMHNTDKIPILEGNWIFLEQNYDRDPFVIDDGVLYNAYNIVFGPAWIGGYYLEAIDLTNGKVLWDHVYYSENVGERRFANRPEIHGDTLELLIHEEYDNTDTFFKPIWFTAYPRRLSFNKRSGDIIYSTFNIPKDPNARKLPVPFPYGPTHLYYEGTDFIVINHLALTDTTTGKSSVWYNRFVLDQHGKEKDNSEMYIPTKYFKISDALYDFESNNSYCFYSSETHPDTLTKNFEIGFHYMNRKMQILDSGKLNFLNTGKENFFSPAFISSDYFIFRSDTIVEQPYYFKYMYLTLFDRKGTPLEKIDLRPLDINSTNINTMQSTLIQTKTGPKILSCVHSRTNRTVDFYLSDGAGQFTKTKSFQTDPSTKTEISLIKIERVGDNILCYFIHRETATRLDPAPLWSSWIMIKGEDLGLLTTNNVVSLDQENTLKILPNPVYDNLTIEFDKVCSGLLYVYNEIGQLVSTKNIEFSKELSFNSSHLLHGKYTIQFITNNKVMSAQFIKVN
ncbi:MAG: T9SS type A sorting domain-containing protein [Saprospiraceae bacterium]|nr:T9SS type A sorting domain-containing protein [Saprospiraceae bacterium]